MKKLFIFLILYFGTSISASADDHVCLYATGKGAEQSIVSIFVLGRATSNLVLSGIVNGFQSIFKPQAGDMDYSARIPGTNIELLNANPKLSEDVYYYLKNRGFPGLTSDVKSKLKGLYEKKVVQFSDAFVALSGEASKYENKVENCNSLGKSLFDVTTSFIYIGSVAGKAGVFKFAPYRIEHPEFFPAD